MEQDDTRLPGLRRRQQARGRDVGSRKIYTRAPRAASGVLIMMMFSYLLPLLMMLGGASPNELLGYLPTNDYWQAKGVTVSVEAMTEELKTLEKDDSKPASVRRLMAIRTLGELKKAESLEVLKPFLDSKEMFVAQYAVRASRAIDGKPSVQAKPDNSQAVRESDLWLLPEGCGAVGQIAINGSPTGVLDIAEMMTQGAHKPDPQMVAMMHHEISGGVIHIAEQVGNFRIDGITLGVSGQIDDDAGFVVFIIRGLYDKKAVAEALGTMGAQQTIDGVDVYIPEGEGTGAIPVSDDQFVLVTGPPMEAKGGTSPIQIMVAALKEKEGSLKANADLTKLINTVDIKSAIWAAVKVSESYREAEQLKAYDTLTLVGKRVADALNFEVKGHGTDADALAESVTQAKAGLEETIADAQRGAAQEPALTPIVDFLKTVQFKSADSDVTITATLKDEAAKSMMSIPFMMMQGGPMDEHDMGDHDLGDPPAPEPATTQPVEPAPM